jgi:hypothetical protein
MTRKKLALICSTVAVGTTISGAAVAISIAYRDSIDTNNNDNPKALNYERCSLNKKITYDTLKSFKVYKVVNDKYMTVIERNNFAKNLNTIYRDLFAKDDRFKSKASSYIVDISHSFKENDTKVDVEVI